MDGLDKFYTVGIWVVSRGNEREFIRTWENFANWVAEHIEGAGRGFLLKNEEQAGHFISFGSWEHPDVAEKWRELKEFQHYVHSLRHLCEQYYPNTMSMVASTRQE